MPRTSVQNSAGYYEQALAGRGLAPPSSSNEYVRGGPLGGLQPPPPFAQPLVETRPGARRAQQSNQPFDVGNVRYNPNFYNTELGQRELRQNQQADTEVAIRNARRELERQSQIVQSGSQVFTPEELAQRREIADSSLAALDSVSPLVSTGLVGRDTVRQVIGQSVSQAINEQRDLRNASKDVQMTTRLLNNNNIGIDQADQILRDIVNEYGLATAMRVSGFAELTGLQGQLQQAREEKLTEFAESRGIDRRFVRWDDRRNAPAFDSEEFQVESFKARTQKEKINSMSAGVSVIAEQANTVAGLINSLAKQGKADSKLNQLYHELQTEMYNAYEPIRSELGMKPSNQRRQPAATPAQPANDVSTAIDSTPAQPPAEPVSYQKFNSQAEVIAAARQDQIEVGKSFMLNGVRTVLGPDGKFKRAK